MVCLQWVLSPLARGAQRLCREGSPVPSNTIQAFKFLKQAPKRAWLRLLCLRRNAHQMPFGVPLLFPLDCVFIKEFYRHDLRGRFVQAEGGHARGQ